jgi:hypothetical protein
MLCGLGRGVPEYLFRYPFSPLVVAKLFSIVSPSYFEPTPSINKLFQICIILQLLIWRQLHASPHVNSHPLYTFIAISDLLALLLVSISLWFMLQKFFWLQIDTALTGFALLFTVMGLYCTWSLHSEAAAGMDGGWWKGWELVYLIVGGGGWGGIGLTRDWEFNSRWPTSTC